MTTGQCRPMLWILALLAWVTLAMGVAPVVGRVLATADRAPERTRRAAFGPRRPVHTS